VIKITLGVFSNESCLFVKLDGLAMKFMCSFQVTRIKLQIKFKCSFIVLCHGGYTTLIRCIKINNLLLKNRCFGYNEVLTLGLKEIVKLNLDGCLSRRATIMQLK
jgi:hypothetical protein